MARRLLKCYEHNHEFEASAENWYHLDCCYRCPICGSPSMDPDAAQAMREVWEGLKKLGGA